MSSLFNALAIPNSSSQLSLLGVNGYTASEALGLDSLAKQDELRTLAATSPAKYAAARNKAIRDLQAQVNGAYNNSYNILAAAAYQDVEPEKELYAATPTGAARVQADGVTAINAAKFKYTVNEAKNLAQLAAQGMLRAGLAQIEETYPINFYNAAQISGARQAQATLAAQGGMVPSISGVRRKSRKGKKKQ